MTTNAEPLDNLYIGHEHAETDWEILPNVFPRRCRQRGHVS
jgi:hypothetical protein